MTQYAGTSQANPATYTFPPSAGMARPFSRVGILGAGETGMAIARALLDADIPVTVFELDRDSLDQAAAATRAYYRDAALDGELTAAERDRRIALLAATVNLHHLKDCDVIVDLLCTSEDVKDGLLRRLNELARPDAVLMAAAGDDGIVRMAALMRFPENVLGLRLSPGAGAGQWEPAPARATSERALATATRLAQCLRLARGTAALPQVC